MEQIEVAIIGGGPAGLRAAEVAASAGRKVVVFDGKPSVGRKFLVAGKGGLNLTHGENFDQFTTRYCGGALWEELLRDFDPQALREWAHSLGQETFQASSGRIYPRSLKGAPLLRAWLGRLKELGVDIRPRHLWCSLERGMILNFQDQPSVQAKAIVFAMGGASWPKTGSDGAWVESFSKMNIGCTDLAASNCGWECDWTPEILTAAEGLPIKNICVSAGGKSLSGELLVTRYGLEGGTIYALGQQLRAMSRPAINIDFKPTFSVEQLVAKLDYGKGNLFRRASKLWKLSEPAAAILSRKSYRNGVELAMETKHCEIPLNCPRPIAEAISSAGGVRWDELDEKLMLVGIPGVFLCGEMIDWDAPTGGYLLQAAFATGTRAGREAAAYVA
ncbi:NAD(P)/FAD-dependent oxidoreductase [Luteolibacter algae]|uniref:NAD(P)/FAD-dependent oxidoreductase n=1 Tax=Luteolibacter algae TaxID=454151 RepID=A0ABW5D9D9_9BACT